MPECSICYSDLCELSLTTKGQIRSKSELYLPEDFLYPLICTTKCGHLFHEACLSNWFQYETNIKTCPQCKIKISLPRDVRPIRHNWKDLCKNYNKFIDENSLLESKLDKDGYLELVESLKKKTTYRDHIKRYYDQALHMERLLESSSKYHEDKHQVIESDISYLKSKENHLDSEINRLKSILSGYLKVEDLLDVKGIRLNKSLNEWSTFDLKFLITSSAQAKRKCDELYLEYLNLSSELVRLKSEYNTAKNRFERLTNQCEEKWKIIELSKQGILKDKVNEKDLDNESKVEAKDSTIQKDFNQTGYISKSILDYEYQTQENISNACDLTIKFKNSNFDLNKAGRSKKDNCNLNKKSQTIETVVSLTKQGNEKLLGSKDSVLEAKTNLNQFNEENKSKIKNYSSSKNDTNFENTLYQKNSKLVTNKLEHLMAKNQVIKEDITENLLDKRIEDTTDILSKIKLD